jgi:hypothetical protein
MLQSVSPQGAVVAIKDAAFPKPFLNQLEYNCPVHEHWNIVHTGMLVPQAHQIYVCAQNCLRGVAMTAAEMGLEDRYSSVALTQMDVTSGQLEKVTIEGVTEVINKLPVRPRAVEVFLVCVHDFVGADEALIYHELERRFPDIDFLRCWMDPIRQKIHLTPEQKERKSMMSVILPRPAVPGSVIALGDDLPLAETSDIRVLLARHGVRFRQWQDAQDYDEYKALGDGAVYMTRSAFAEYGMKEWSKTVGRPGLYLPPAVTAQEIRALLEKLLAAVLSQADQAALHDEVAAFTAQKQAQVEKVYADLAERLSGWKVAVDYVSHPRPLGLARFLIAQGIDVQDVYLDIIYTEEKTDFHWLQEHAPALRLHSTNHVKAQVLPRERAPHVLGIGPKSAYFEDTPYFVNMIENDGNWGYDGLLRLADRMKAALDEAREPKQVVQKKGLGMVTVL